MTRELLSRSFFNRPPDDVARDLIGTMMMVCSRDEAVTVRIVESEAYGGDDDPASHAFRGRTPRNSTMFGPAGCLYVYRSYGVHWCMNVVTQGIDVASAVLLRAAELVSGDLLIPSTANSSRILRGPGSLTNALNVTGDDNGRDCCGSDARITFDLVHEPLVGAVLSSPRVGISRGRERLSRYYLEGSPAVSKVPRVRNSME
jgi:DNA-3-methyladenine glycosylase